MIRFILIQNRAGKTRLAKWYTQVSKKNDKLDNEIYVRFYRPALDLSEIFAL